MDVHGMLDGLVVCLAVGCAGVGGWCCWRCYRAWRRRAHLLRAVREEAQRGEGSGPAAMAGKGDDLVSKIIAFALSLDRRSRSGSFQWLAPPSLRKRAVDERPWEAAGLEGCVSSAVVWEARVRLALCLGAIGLVLGLTFSLEMGMLAGAGGVVAGWQALPWAVGRRAQKRTEEMERHLSEMLDVVALGLRSGLSFDRGLDLYVSHFDSLLAHSFSRAQGQWVRGLASRPDALRHVAASYASPLLERIVENIIRSLRFGSTLADNLEDAAREARRGYQVRKEEQVAKAPVKMMVPTGMLILPAMLLLVLGPVLLELAGGF